MRILKYFAVSVCTILGLLLIAVEFTERLTLPNGLYIYKIPFIPASFAERGYYIYNQDDELIVEEPVEFICFNDDYLEGNTFAASGFFIYEIATKKTVTYLQPEYFTVSEKSGLYNPKVGCDGYLKYNIGTNLLWMKPSRLTGDRKLKMLRGN